MPKSNLLQSDGDNSESSFLTTPPGISLPKGGGAIRGIGEKFAANPVTGTGSMTVPIFVSPGRSGFGPQLALSYDSGAGNGPFGFGWNLSLPAITRKTDKGLPKYFDAEESDVFLLSGAEDLVPVLVKQGSLWVPESVPDRTVDNQTYVIKPYRPRIEGLFARIERWSNKDNPQDTFWRSISRDNITTWYGKKPESRIIDPGDPTRIFSWLICETHDDKGNVIVYRYQSEDGENVDLSQVHERNRGSKDDPLRSANRYLKRIFYGNLEPYLPKLKPDSKWPAPGGAEDEDGRAHWMFEVVFDYEQGHYTTGQRDADGFETVDASTSASEKWGVRNDPFSTYRAGFEVRTYRLCQRVLMFHHFPLESEVGAHCLVRSTDFSYSFEQRSLEEKDPFEIRNPVFSFLRSVTQSGYRRSGGNYIKRSLPPLEFEYTEAIVDGVIREVDGESLENLPYGLDEANYQWIDLDGEGLPGILTEQADGWFYKRNLSPVHLASERDLERARARFAPVELVSVKPNSAIAGGQAQFMDLAGDGQPDLVVLDGPSLGLYEHDEGTGWNTFRPFESQLNRRTRDPNLRFVDLDGDGHADVLITEDEALTWHPSLAEDGFGPARRVSKERDEEKGPALVFADGTESVYVADLSGDGLSDLVRIRNGEVCYWPNLGYGKFGAKVTMDNSPWFDASDLFDQRRVHLADIDGSGTTDIIYLHSDGARLYFNQSGNRWSEPHTLSGFPRTDSASAVAVVDLLCNGTACLVWSTPLPEETRQPMRYIDLMGGQKPHLLIKTTNNLGAETEVQYAPSTKFYLEDKLAGKPWITRLPFPVHCVVRVSVHDKWRDTTFTSRYSYHHGYFDGVEREFRGFGRVEQVDAEDYGKFSAGNRTSPYITDDQTLFQPPVKTVTWFHTGALVDGTQVLSQYRDEYFPRWLEALRPDTADVLGGFQENALPEPDFADADLSSDEWREALRACKGMPLRQEIYELDVDALKRDEENPVKLFSTAYHNCHIDRLQPQGLNRHAAFLVVESEAITYHYELDLESIDGNAPPDPRIVHNLNLRFDKYGRVLQSVAVVYSRRGEHSDPSLTAQQIGLIIAVQQEQHLAYSEARFTNELPADPDNLRLPAPCEMLAHEITGIKPEDQSDRLTTDPVDHLYFTIDELRDYRFNEELDTQASKAVAPLAYHEQPRDETPHMRLVERSITLYFKDDLSGALEFGMPGRLGLTYETYKLALTSTLLDKILGAKFDNETRDTLNKPTATPGFFASGYRQGQALFGDIGNGEWWMRSGVAGFASDAADHFYLPERYTDPFGSVSTLAFDSRYDLFIESATDEFGNTVAVTQFDYRVLAPAEMSDMNHNLSEVAFDILGMPVASALKGKQHGASGDNLAGLRTDVGRNEIKDFFTDAYASDKPTEWLQEATVRYVYDLGESLAVNGAVTYGDRPAAACGILRENHVNASGETTIQVGIEFSDGVGTVLVKKAQAEPDPDITQLDPDSTQSTPLRWIASGKTILNNKGKPVKQYEPYFSDTEHRFDPKEAQREVGVTPVMYYDAPGRLIRTESPDGSFSKVEFTPWHVVTYDQNDTAFDHDPSRRSEWYNRRTDPTHPKFGEFNTAEDARAARLVEMHSNTAGLTILDSLGREVISIAHNRFSDQAGAVRDEKYLTFTKSDAEGKPLWIRDALGHLVMQYITPPKSNNDPSNAMPPDSVPCYDIAGNLLFQHSMDAGERWMLMDAAGKLMLAWDFNKRQDENHDFVDEQRLYFTEYDALHRPTRQWLATNGEPRQMIERFEYQDAITNDDKNLNGQLVFHYDPSGRAETVRRDFKGNVLEVKRRLNNRPTSPLIDWQTDPDESLATEEFTQITEFDALNRMTRQYNWHRGLGSLVAIYQPVYNERGLLKSETLRVRARKTALGANETGSQMANAITEIRYNEKGQKIYLALGNGTLSEFEYDRETFRLRQIFTTRPAQQRPYQDRRSQLQDNRVIQELNYIYDPVGNISEIADQAYKPVFFSNAIVEPRGLYEYDALYRLIKATGRENGQLTGAPTNIEGNAPDFDFPITDPLAQRKYTQDYTYDSVGNISRIRHQAGPTGNWTRDYRYAFDDPNQQVSNRLWQTWTGGDSANATTHEHDHHGNMLNLARTDPRFNMRWDHRDMIRQIDLGGGGNAFYQYDSSKQRTRKRIERNGGVEQRIYLGGYELYRRYNSANSTISVEEIESHHLFEGEQRVLLVDDVISTNRTHANGTSYKTGPIIRFQYSNHLGSACLELDHQAEIISYEEYHPYGTSAFRAMKSSIEATPKRYRYTGMERDQESEFYYHGARYYAPWLGRWTSADPAGPTDGSNTYLYCRCLPTRFSDSTGFQAEEQVLPEGYRWETYSIAGRGGQEHSVRFPVKEPAPEAAHLGYEGRLLNEGLAWRVGDSSAMTSGPEGSVLSAPPLIQAEERVPPEGYGWETYSIVGREGQEHSVRLRVEEPAPEVVHLGYEGRLFNEGLAWRVGDSPAMTSSPEEPASSAPPLVQAEPVPDAPIRVDLIPRPRTPLEYSLSGPPVPDPANAPSPAVFSEPQKRGISLSDAEESFLKERFRSTYNLLSSEPIRDAIRVGPGLRSALSGKLTSLATENALSRDLPTLLESFNLRTTPVSNFATPMISFGISWDFPGLSFTGPPP